MCVETTRGTRTGSLVSLKESGRRIWVWYPPRNLPQRWKGQGRPDDTSLDGPSTDLTGFTWELDLTTPGVDSRLVSVNTEGQKWVVVLLKSNVNEGPDLRWSIQSLGLSSSGRVRSGPVPQVSRGPGIPVGDSRQSLGEVTPTRKGRDHKKRSHVREEKVRDGQGSVTVRDPNNFYSTRA